MRIFEARTLRTLLWTGLIGGVIAAVGVLLSLGMGIVLEGPWFGLLALWLVPSLWALDRVPVPGAGVAAGLIGGVAVGFVWPLFWPALVYSLLYAAAVEAVFLAARYRRSSVGLSAVAGGVGGAAIAVHWLIAWVGFEGGVDAIVFAPIVGGLAVGAVVALVRKRGRQSAVSVEST